MDYLIGAGAILTSGNGATITPATLHAQLDPILAPRIGAAAFDFEGTSPDALSRLLVMAAGLNASEFRKAVTGKLLERGDCTLADVLGLLARGAGVGEVHLFAHWLPSSEMCAQLQAAGIGLVTHPLEVVRAASLVAARRRERWRAA